MKNVFIRRFILTLLSLGFVIIMCITTAFLIDNVAFNGIIGMVWGGMGVLGWMHLDYKWGSEESD